MSDVEENVDLLPSAKVRAAALLRRAPLLVGEVVSDSTIDAVPDKGLLFSGTDSELTRALRTEVADSVSMPYHVFDVFVRKYDGYIRVVYSLFDSNQTAGYRAYSCSGYPNSVGQDGFRAQLVALFSDICSNLHATVETLKAIGLKWDDKPRYMLCPDSDYPSFFQICRKASASAAGLDQNLVQLPTDVGLTGMAGDDGYSNIKLVLNVRAEELPALAHLFLYNKCVALGLRSHGTLYADSSTAVTIPTLELDEDGEIGKEDQQKYDAAIKAHVDTWAPLDMDVAIAAGYADADLKDAAEHVHLNGARVYDQRYTLGIFKATAPPSSSSA